jgi:LPS export ABC transporter protein LptC
LKKLFLLALLCTLIFSCENDIAVVNMLVSPSNLPVESGKNVKILYSDSAKIKVKLFAPQMDRYIKNKESFVELPKGLVLEFYNDSMRIISNLSSNYAIRHEKERTMEAKNDVVVVNEKGEKLNTEHLIWDEGAKRIYSEAFVRITTKDEIIYGDGFESNEKFTRYKIKNVKGTISINESK